MLEVLKVAVVAMRRAQPTGLGTSVAVHANTWQVNFRRALLTHYLSGAGSNNRGGPHSSISAWACVQPAGREELEAPAAKRCPPAHSRTAVARHFHVSHCDTSSSWGLRWHHPFAVALPGAAEPPRFSAWSSIASKAPHKGVRRFSGGGGHGLKKVLRGKYEMIKELGAGAFGVVMLCRTVATGQLVAIKILDRDDMEDSNNPKLLSHSEELVAREVYAMMAIRHPYIVRLLDVAATVRQIFLVMEYMAGGALITRIERQGNLSEDESRRHFQCLIDAVHFCHTRGVYHRDLKPDNLLLDASHTLKVADFGLAALKRLDDTSLQGPVLQSLAGSRPYMAPELLFSPRGTGFLGAPNDVWACGVILYICCAGYHPFWTTGEPSDVIYNKIRRAKLDFPKLFPAGAAALVSRILNPDPVGRPTCRDIFRDPWFQTNYRPPDFRAVPDLTGPGFQDVHNTFRGQPPAGVTEHDDQLPAFSALDFLSQSSPLDDALSPLFRRLGRDTTVRSETRFTSHLSAKKILQQIAVVVEKHGFQVEMRQHMMKMDNVAIARTREPLCVVVEVSSVLPRKAGWSWPGGNLTDGAGLKMVVFRRVTGNAANYQHFINWLAPQIKDTIVQVGPRPP